MDRAVAPPHDPPAPATEQTGPVAGGARSFAEYELQRDALDLTSTFTALVSNALADPNADLATKATTIQHLAEELAERVGDKGARPSLLSRLLGRKAAVPAAAPAAAAPAPKATHAPSGFTSFKDAAGDWRWLAIYSNNLEDRERETFALDAHREFAGHCETMKAYPELWLWHTPGSRIGQSDYLDVDDSGFVVASGTYDPGMESAAERLKEITPLGVSHGYRYTPGDLVDGVYQRYRTFEISPLPLDRAANLYTGFLPGQEEVMLSQDRREFLVKVLGPDQVTTLEHSLGDWAAKARAEGVSFKAVGEALAGLVPDLGGQAVATPAPAPAPPTSDDTVKALKEALDAALAPVTTQLTAIAGKVDAHGEAITALQRSDDEKAAGTWMPKARPLGDKAATAQGGTVVAENDPLVQAMKAQNGQVPAHLADYVGMNPLLDRVLNGVGAGN